MKKIIHELSNVLDQVDSSQVQELMDSIDQAERIFCWCRSSFIIFTSDREKVEPSRL